MEYEPDPRHAELIVKSSKSGKYERSEDSVSQEKVGRCVWGHLHSNWTHCKRDNTVAW